MSDEERGQETDGGKAEASPDAEAKPPWLADPAPPEWQDADDDPLAGELVSAHGEAVLSALEFAGDLVLEIVADRIAEVCSGLKDRGYSMLVDLCGVDYPDRDQRFEVVYQLYNFDDNRRIRLKARVAEDGEVPTVCTVWRAANWMEREAWDMYGIRFAGHPDLTRILTWEGFHGHPLRKDFPVEGIDTGAAAYPEYYLEDQGPVAGTGTGWKPPQPPEPQPPEPQPPEPQPPAPESPEPEPDSEEDAREGTDADGESES